MANFLSLRMILICLAASISISNKNCTASERPATVLLITSKSLADAWQPFANWKTRSGKATKIVSVEEIGEDYEGKDIQQKIRACVLDHVDNHGTKWVILGGDSQPGGKGIVPDRDSKHPNFRYSDIPTDVYYLSRKSWDENGDGVYGDWSVDRKSIEYTHPKASIGRIPVRTADDVNAYTKKAIDYDTKYPAKNFARRMVYTCPERSAYPKLGTSNKVLAKHWSDGKIDQFFANKTPWDKDKPGDYDLSPANWAKMINSREVGKLHIHGHGFLPVWVLEKHKTVTAKTVDTLSNTDAYPIITTVSCFTGHYDAKKDPAITESMIRKADGGAIAIIAPAREGVPVFANRADFRKMITEGKMDGTTRMLTEFWTNGLEKKLTIGEAVSAAKAKLSKEAAEHAGFHWVLSELNLLGDPTLDMRAADPVTLDVKAPKSISTTTREVKVEAEKPGMTVCLWKGDEVYVTAVTDEKGAAALAVAPKTAGKMLLTVSGPSANTYAGEIAVE